jgi:hypothetical protein
MSVMRFDVNVTEMPKRGILPPSFHAELRWGQFKSMAEVYGTPLEQRTQMQQMIVDRIYGDVSVNFEALLKLVFPHEEPTGKALELREKIRGILRGDGSRVYGNGGAWKAKPLAD